VKSFKVILIYLLGFSGALSAAERLDEDMAKALIVRQLLSLIEGHDNLVKAQQLPAYQLCTYNDRNTAQKLSRHLEGLLIQQKPFNIRNIQQRQDIQTCHAAFINQPKDDDLDWFLANQATINTLFIINGETQAQKGFHIGLYLNNQKTFDFELNPSVLITSNFTPRKELLQFGKIVGADFKQKINLLRTLINYTEWSADKHQFAQHKDFQLCTLANATLATFIDHFADGKTFKGKKLANRTIQEASEAESCDAIVINQMANQDAVTLLSQRAEQRVLLIGNNQALGERGVHYNISPPNKTQRRFEINLIAFEQTGHSPHFELFNSASVVETDYPELSRTLNNIVQMTEWPGEADNQADNEAQHSPIDFCVFDDPVAQENLQLFLADRKTLVSGTSSKPITARLVSEVAALAQCDAFMVSADPPSQVAEFLEKQTLHPLLLIARNDKQVLEPYHYRLLMAPKRISFELNLEQLKAGGFKPAKALLDLGKVIRQGVQQ